MSSQLVISFIAKLHSSSFKFGSLPTTWTRSTTSQRVLARPITIELIPGTTTANQQPRWRPGSWRDPEVPSIPTGTHNNAMTTWRNWCLNLWIGFPMVRHHRFMAGGVNALFYALDGTKTRNKSKRETGSSRSKLVKNAKYTMYWLYVLNCILYFSYPLHFPE